MDHPHLKRVSVLSLVDGSQHRLVDPEAHGGGDQSQGQVADHTEDDDHVGGGGCDVESDSPDEGDVSDGEEADEDRAADDAGVPGVVPVQEGAELAGGEPHDADHRGQRHW